MVTLPPYFLFIEKSKLGNGTPENKVSKKSREEGCPMYLQFVVVGKLLKTRGSEIVSQRGRGMQKKRQTEVIFRSSFRKLGEHII